MSPKIKAALGKALAARSADVPVKGRMEAFVACDKLQEWRRGLLLGVDRRSRPT
jgi:hypothetical protein